MALGKVIEKPYKYCIQQLKLLLGESETNSKLLDLRTRLQRAIQINVLAGGSPRLAVPSVIELADAFQCTEMDVMEALYELTQQGYDFKLSALDRPIILADPYAELHEYAVWYPVLKQARA
jgi:hypothetical protein